jgi:hypothetical protein
MRGLDSLKVIAPVLRVSCVLVQMVQFPRMRCISNLIGNAKNGANYWDHLGGLIAIIGWPQLARPPLGQFGGRILLSDLGCDLIATHCRVSGFRRIRHRRARSQQRQAPRTHQETTQYRKGWRHRFPPSKLTDLAWAPVLTAPHGPGPHARTPGAPRHLPAAWIHIGVLSCVHQRTALCDPWCAAIRENPLTPQKLCRASVLAFGRAADPAVLFAASRLGHLRKRNHQSKPRGMPHNALYVSSEHRPLAPLRGAVAGLKSAAGDRGTR